ncbi:phage holin family protein [Demequina sp. B12]|uniref:phage holin family protein n=1 Tax=Demequina sp. B12 TaxID=2992757 RepID=UPI00237AF53F|nr:phage holin family protein [Demequina sp. B12]MDE0573491.1 phage holin family protein [Demequina sp. B12]
MVRFLWNTLTNLIAAVVGLWVADYFVDGFDTQLSGFIVAVLIFVVAQALFSPFIFKMAVKYAKALQGGVALISTFVALLLTTIFTDGLTIDGVTAWLLGTVIVWLASALAGWILLTFLLKSKIDGKD